MIDDIFISLVFFFISFLTRTLIALNHLTAELTDDIKVNNVMRYDSLSSGACWQANASHICETIKLRTPYSCYGHPG